jgi:hypothetical protein
MRRVFVIPHGWLDGAKLSSAGILSSQWSVYVPSLRHRGLPEIITTSVLGLNIFASLSLPSLC